MSLKVKKYRGDHEELQKTNFKNPVSEKEHKGTLFKNNLSKVNSA